MNLNPPSHTPETMETFTVTFNASDYPPLLYALSGMVVRYPESPEYMAIKDKITKAFQESLKS